MYLRGCSNLVKNENTEYEEETEYKYGSLQFEIYEEWSSIWGLGLTTRQNGILKMNMMKSSEYHIFFKKYSFLTTKLIYSFLIVKRYLKIRENSRNWEKKQ